ncbi:MAG: hypothetical protein JST92_01150, partial [Deltaproteobacteria bacterium]|nr:hypothetical protein [Deltaproteobacteria bacterium]
AALLAGGALALLSHSTSNDLTSGPHSTADVQALQSRADSQRSASNALFIAGGVLVVAAAVLYVLHE